MIAFNTHVAGSEGDQEVRHGYAPGAGAVDGLELLSKLIQLGKEIITAALFRSVVRKIVPQWIRRSGLPSSSALG